MSKNNFRPPDTTEALTEQLKGKSRSRRANLKRLAAPAAAARAMRNDVLPNLEIVIVALSELRSAPRKVRKCDPAHVREVAGSISALGFCSPILIGDDNVVLDGEIRVEAVRLLGLDSVPCIRMAHLSKVEQRLLRMAVNRLAEKGEWDLDELKIEIEELILAGAPIEISGFSLDEIDQIVIGDKPEAVEKGRWRQTLALSQSPARATYSNSGLTA
jgi:hypothetical protein